MPASPVPTSRCLQGRDSVETPAKVARPRRRGLLSGSLYGQHIFGKPVLHAPRAQLSSQSAEDTKGNSVPTLHGMALMESFASLTAADILPAAAACVAWHRIVESPDLWHLATPRLRLTERIIWKQEIAKRRSRGTVWHGVLLGARKQEVVVRCIHLWNVNANENDGLPPSVVREVAFLHSIARMRHSSFVRLVGAEVTGDFAYIATEKMAKTFEFWASRTPALPEIRDFFKQLLEAVAFLHARGIFHRNLKPMNVLFDPESGAINLTDLDHGRSVDVPLVCYTPQDPRMRQQSNRENCRLYYKAPELILRKEIYGPSVDMWAVGCLLAEAGSLKPLFEAEHEMSCLFRIFSVVGTPGLAHCPEALKYEHFSAKFPVYEPVDFGRVTRAVIRSTAGDFREVRRLQQEMHNRADVCDQLLWIAQRLMAPGMILLQSLLRLDPTLRSTAEEALRMTIFSDPSEPVTPPSRRRCRGLDDDFESRRVRQKSQHSPSSQLSDAPMVASQVSLAATWSQDISSQQEMNTPATAVAQILARCQLLTQSSQGSPVKRRVCGTMSGDALWPKLWAEMVRQDMVCRPPVSMLPRSAALQWQREVDLVLDAAIRWESAEQTFHLAVALLHDVLSDSSAALDPTLAVLACIKLSDAMLEKSMEYFTQKRTKDLKDACGTSWSKEDIIEAEKVVFRRLQSTLHRPTAHWFLRSCFHTWCQEAEVRGNPRSSRPFIKDVGVMARFINTCCLYDSELQAQPASLRAQISLLLAVHCISQEPDCPGMVFQSWRAVRATTCSSNSRDEVVPVFSRICRAVAVQSARPFEQLNGDPASVPVPAETRYPTCSRRIPPNFPPELVEELLPSLWPDWFGSMPPM